jgi:glycosyltransferase involved in cell wall biosynthesis
LTAHLAIVPAYNEAGAIANTVADIHRHDVVVVDDGSTDETARVARAAGAEVLKMPFNLGIGGAMQAGYLYALDRGYQVAVQVDGDGQHDARHIAELLNHLKANPDVNMVTGSRFIDKGAEGFRSSAPRRAGIRLFGWLLSAIVGRRITDPTSGFRMTDRAGIELFARDYPHDYPEVEAIVMSHAHRLNGMEVPVRMRERQAGVSSINATASVVYMTKVTLAVFVGLLRARPAVEPGQPAPVHAEHAL